MNFGALLELSTIVYWFVILMIVCSAMLVALIVYRYFIERLIHPEVKRFRAHERVAHNHLEPYSISSRTMRMWQRQYSTKYISAVHKDRKRFR